MAQNIKHTDLSHIKDTALQRSISLPLLVLYGLGVTVGAGVYVLIGATAAKAGIYAPISFILAAIVVGFTGFTYSELSTRYPASAGEAVYVKNGFNSNHLALIVGLMVVTSGVVSSAAISIGATAYTNNLIDLSPPFLTAIIILLLGLAAAWGVLQSVTMAAVFTVIEIGGLCFVVFYGFTIKPDMLSDLAQLIPPLDASVWAGITSAGLLAFFAFVGFEDIANMAEEVKNPRKNMPRAIIVTLLIATLLYLAVVSVVVLVVPMDQLVISVAPLELVFAQASDSIRGTFSIIAILATVNGVLIQMIMATRVLYGLASKGHLPKQLAYIHPKTQTPLVATAIIVAIVLGLALFLPIQELARFTATIVLCVFILVNISLIRIKLRKKSQTDDHFQTSNYFSVPIWVPVAGLASSSALLLVGLV